MLARYRATGADPPFGDPRRAHGVAMEGYYWRLAEPAAGAVVIALVAVNRDSAGRSWGLVALGAHPGGLVRWAVADHAEADPRTLGVRVVDAGRPVLVADAGCLRVDLGADATLRVELDRALPWPRRALGGIGPAQVLPALSQHWHPWLLRARARGEARLGAGTLRIDGWGAYAEKNWGAGGFPGQWWWGHAQGLGDDPDAVVAFAGGPARAFGLPVTATSVVVHAGGRLVRLTRPPALLGVAVGDDGWRIAGRTARHRLDLEGEGGAAGPHLLPVPLPAERRAVDGAAAQHLAGRLRVTLRSGRRTILRGESALAGLERPAPGVSPERTPRRGVPPG